jgi:(2Fe-2S) ferredoxin
MDTPQIPQPTFYIFKCEQGTSLGVKKPSCVDKESQDLFNHMAQSLMLKGIMGPVQAIKTNCLGRCQVGPVMIIEPGHHMYVQLDKEKIDKIIEEHIIGGNPVNEYIISEQLWGEPQMINRN